MPVEPPHYPGVAAPERFRMVAGVGVSLRVHEWGDPEAPAVLLCHGMFDHGRGFDLLAPLLADRFRVLAMDARGHGESSWADAYSWPSDVIDIGSVLADLGRPAHLVGHSKGGGQATDAATCFPDCVRKLVNIDGFGPPDEEGFRPDDRPPRSLPEHFGEFLDRRRLDGGGRGWRPYASFDDLVERRRVQNPRLGREWLRYFLHFGSREVEDGWVWRADPLAGRGFGPFKPQWIGPEWRHLRSPMLAVIGSEPDTWGPIPEPIRRERLDHVPELEEAVIEGSGHFAHMEQPVALAELLDAFLDR